MIKDLLIDEQDRKKVSGYKWHINAGYLRGWVAGKKKPNEG